MSRILFVVIIIVCPGILFSQDCYKLFRTSYEKLKSVKAPSDGSGLLIAYGVETVSSEDLVSSERFVVKSFGKKSSIISENIEVYQDENTMVAIQKFSNAVFITKPLPQALKQTQLNGFAGLQDSLVNQLGVKSCVSEPVSDCKSCKKITLELPIKLKNITGVKEVIYFIDEEKQQIKKITIDFLPDESRSMKSLSYSIERIDSSYKQVPFDGKAISIVMDNGKLLPKYKGYELIDQRK